MSIQQSFLGNLRNIHIPKLSGTVFVQEDIGRFQISMENLDVMEGLEASDYLYEYFPYIFLLNILLVLLVHSNFLEQVAVVRILHHNAILNTIRLKLFQIQNTYHKLLLDSSMKASL